MLTAYYKLITKREKFEKDEPGLVIFVKEED